jgi:hypothetical protein
MGEDRMTTTPEQIEAVFREMAERNRCSIYTTAACPEERGVPSYWCNKCLIRLAAEAWAERKEP